MEQTQRIDIGSVAMLLVRYRSDVEKRLREEKMLDAFVTAVGQWHTDYPANTPTEVNAKAEALIAIVHRFDIDRFLMERWKPWAAVDARAAGDRVSHRDVRGPVRTRGAAQARALVSAEALNEVASIYTCGV